MAVEMGHEMAHYVYKEIKVFATLVGREVTGIGVFEIGQEPILL